MRRFALAFVAAMLLAGCAQTPPKSDQSVYFIEPKDGETVTSPFKVVFGVTLSWSKAFGGAKSE